MSRDQLDDGARDEHGGDPADGLHALADEGGQRRQHGPHGEAGGGGEQDDRLSGWDPDRPMDDGNPFGTPESEIHWQVDVRDLVETKRAALACHRSQRTDIEGFLSMPVDVYAQAFGWEWAIEPGRAPGLTQGFWLDEA